MQATTPTHREMKPFLHTCSLVLSLLGAYASTERVSRLHRPKTCFWRGRKRTFHSRARSPVLVRICLINHWFAVVPLEEKPKGGKVGHEAELDHNRRKKVVSPSI